jgi:hypothetical protein
MVTDADLYVPRAVPLLSASEALLFQEIIVSQTRFWSPIIEIYGLVLGTSTFSLHISLDQNLIIYQLLEILKPNQVKICICMQV